jgi:hypothetical protein
VNNNIYSSKDQVYLNGGPSSNGNCGPAGLPAGDYYFQVTDPSGQTLLSTDAITNRKITVGADGVFVSADNHPTHAGNCNGVTVKLMPFADTPNNGGEYKVWLTPVADYSEGDGTFGFSNQDSKTDNFKVIPSTTTGSTGVTLGCLHLFKIYDKNTDGLETPGETVLDSWRFSVQDIGNSGPIVYYSTPIDVFLAPGTYQVCDIAPLQRNWVPTIPLCSIVDVTPGDCVDVLRGCVCVGPAGAHSLSWWTGATGQATITAGDLAILSALNLKTSTGTNFDPATVADLVTYLNGASTAFPQYFLSAQLAVSVLNTNHFVSPAKLILGRGVAIAAGYPSGFFPVMSAQSLANTAIGTVGPDTALGIATVLMNANNDLIWVQDTPCPYSFAPLAKRAIAESESAYEYQGIAF